MTMLISDAPSSTECYFSPLADEPDLAELVSMFVSDLPDRVAELRRYAGYEDWSEVRRLAHQLKGAGGSYGFPHLSRACEHVETAAKRSDVACAIGPALDSLAAACAAARPGSSAGGRESR
jgi:HPt (histidine-containing phosphotransfer) domain-containing protein